MKIAFLASEVAPFAKTGGLADVAGALPGFLSRAGDEVRVFMPFYREVKKKNLSLRKTIDHPGVQIGKEKVPFSVWESASGASAVSFVENDKFFDRDCLYGTPAGDYPDNSARFAFFSRACLETLKQLNFAPQILHCHDWQTALTLAYLKFTYADDPFFKPTRSLFTIHNLAYQGLFPKDVLSEVGLPDHLFNPDGLEYYGKVNFLKAGILYSTAVNTVSPRYSREIQTPEFGYGLEGLLKARKKALFGILNGVDYSDWNPSTDRFLPAPFSPVDMNGKETCKKELLTLFELPQTSLHAPVAGMVSRLAGQKGLDILCEALEEIIRLGVLVVVLGTGEEKIQEILKSMQKKHPSHIGLKIAFNEAVAHSVYAGSDLFLIPSRYEPCGLTQMYSLKYGTIPLVRATGGLDDTIQEYDPDSHRGNGFKFEDYSAKALVETLERALQVYERNDQWKRLISNAMSCDFSWERAVGEYLKLYKMITKI